MRDMLFPHENPWYCMLYLWNACIPLPIRVLPKYLHGCITVGECPHQIISLWFLGMHVVSSLGPHVLCIPSYLASWVGCAWEETCCTWLVHLELVYQDDVVPIGHDSESIRIVHVQGIAELACTALASPVSSNAGKTKSTIACGHLARSVDTCAVDSDFLPELVGSEFARSPAVSPSANCLSNSVARLLVENQLLR
jgi:hypothetical protein